MTFGAPGDRTYKLVLIGDGAVGKTSIRERYLGKGFKRSQLAEGDDGERPTIEEDIEGSARQARFVLELAKEAYELLDSTA